MRVFILEAGNKRRLFRIRAWLVAEKLFGLLFQILIQESEGDIQRADSFAFSAVDAAAGKMDGPDHVID